MALMGNSINFVDFFVDLTTVYPNKGKKELREVYVIKD
jgi:hypothetical protein